MIRIDEPAMPTSAPTDLRTEVEHRAIRFRRRHRVAGGAMIGTALATVVALLALALEPGEGSRTTRVGARRTTVLDPGVEGIAPPAPPDLPPQTPEGPAVTAPVTVGRPTVTSPNPPSKSNGKGASSVAPLANMRHKVLVERLDGLFEIGPEGGSRKVSAYSSTRPVRWSPDGRYVLFRDGSGTTLDVLDLQDGTTRRVFSGSNKDDVDGGAAWMPDSRTVVFLRRITKATLDQDTALWTLDVVTGELRQLRDRPNIDDGSLSVARDGRILHRCTIDSRPQLCLTDRHGTDLGPVPNSTGPMDFEISPDGGWIAFGGNDGDRGILRVFRTDGSEERRIVSDRVDSTTRPAWSADGSRIIFGLRWADHHPPPCDEPPPCPGDGGIWSVRLDGSDARPVAGTGNKDQLIGVAPAP